LTASGVDTLSKRIPDVGPVPGWIAEASAVALLFVAGGTAIYINDSRPMQTESSPMVNPNGVGTSITSIPESAWIFERSDNTAGTQVYSNNEGAAPPASVPSRIAFGVGFWVACYAANYTGSSSDGYLYLIPTGVWHGLMAVSSTATNGGPFPNTTSPDLDPRVKPCPSDVT
jgi:hypothetical protein